MELGRILRILTDVPATVPAEREPAAPASEPAPVAPATPANP